MYIRIHAKCPLFTLDFNQLRYFLPGFEKYSIKKVHENTPLSSQVVPCGQTDERTGKYDEGNSRLLQFCERA